MITPYERDDCRLRALSLEEAKSLVASEVFHELVFLEPLVAAGRLPKNIREWAANVAALTVHMRWEKGPAHDQQRLKYMEPGEFFQAAARHSSTLRPQEAAPKWVADDVLTWTREDAAREAGNGTYQATFLIEQLADKRILWGHGPTARQHADQLVALLIGAQWRGTIRAWLTRWYDRLRSL